MQDIYQLMTKGAGQPYSDNIALICGAREVSYRALFVAVDELASTLEKTLDAEETCVAIAVDASIDYIVSLLAVIKVGRAFVPVGTHYPIKRLDKIADLSGLTTIISHSSFTLSDQAWSRSELQSSSESLNLWRRQDVQPRPSMPDGLGYILSTSGSTGEPKLILGSARGLLHFIQWEVQQFDIEPSMRTSFLSPVTFDVSLRDIFVPLVSGATLCIPTEEERTEPLRLLQWLHQQRINFIHIVPTLFRGIMQGFDQQQTIDGLTDLKAVLLAGEALYTADVTRWYERFGYEAQLVNIYGPSETTLAKLFYPIPQVLGVDHAIVPLGYPLPDTQLFVVDEAMELVQDGELGELCIATPYRSFGYLNAGESNSSAFTWLVVDGVEHDIYRTGDLVHRNSDDDGAIYFHSRKDHQIKLHGQRIEINEVESALSLHPDIDQCVVQVEGDVTDLQKLVAYIVTAEDELAVDQLRTFVGKSLPDYMIPAEFIFLTALPTNANGKVDRKQLKRSDKRTRPLMSVAFVAPQSALEKTLVAIWADALALDRIGVDDNFFDLGGTSLLGMRTLPLIQQQLDTPVSIAEFFEAATVRRLAKKIDAKRNNTNASSANASVGVKRKVSNQDIAIVGLACRVPGADNQFDFWANLLEGKESIRFFADHELDASLSDELVKQPNYIKARGVIEHHDCFDGDFFNIADREADILDPQQRILIELGHHALEDACLDPDVFEGAIGVFAGVGDNSYFTRNLLNHSVAASLGEHRLRLANEKDYVAPRIAYSLNLNGPAVSVHTACSTSLVAIAQGVQSLRDTSSDAVLCGGAYVPCPLFSGYTHAEGGFAAADGHCRPFDAEATGTVFSAGAGIVVLKRLDDAITAGDKIYGLVKGVGINNDGGGKMSFMAPSATGQAQAVARAVTDAGIQPEAISFIESHGTATPLGDPIEVEALSQIYGPERCQRLGSVKGNLGHLDAAAGVVGFIKAVLSLHHQVLPASINFASPNPNIDFEKLGFSVNDQLSALDDTADAHFAAVSAFGVGGTNAHVILKQWKPAASAATQSQSADRDLQLLLLSAKSDAALSGQAGATQQFLANHDAIADVAFTQALARKHYPYRAFAVVTNSQDALNQLAESNFITQHSGRRQLQSQPQPTPVVFMFPGQGAQYVGMANELYRQEPLFRQWVDDCAERLQPFIDKDIRDIIYAETADDKALINETRYAQPALFVIGYALAQLWQSYDVKPNAMIGHSIGEYIAACLAGVFSLDDALKLVVARGAMMQEQPGGAMLSAPLSQDDLTHWIKDLSLIDSCSVAAVNGPTRCVASGAYTAIDTLKARLADEGIDCKVLKTSHAFHSAMMQPVVEPFRDQVANVTLNKPDTPIMSTATGQWLTDEQAIDPDYWAQHLRDPVLFATAITQLWQADDYLLLELGPRSSASQLARQQSKNPMRQIAVPSLADSNDQDLNQWLYAVGKLWAEGVNIDWQAFYHNRSGQRISLPGYAFERKVHWLAPELATATAVIASEAGTVDSSRQEPDIQSSTIENVCRIVSQMTGLEVDQRMGDLSFFELGLDSLSMTQLSVALKQQMGADVSLRLLTGEYSTISSLTEYIKSKDGIVVSANTDNQPTKSAIGEQHVVDHRYPPIPGARLGRDPEGNPGWYIPDEGEPGQFYLIQVAQGQ